MAGFQIVEYKGHQILVFTWLPPGQDSFKATYHVQLVDGNSRAGSVKHQGVIVGALGTAESAEEAALARAKGWIDTQVA